MSGSVHGAVVVAREQEQDLDPSMGCEGREPRASSWMADDAGHGGELVARVPPPSPQRLLSVCAPLRLCRVHLVKCGHRWVAVAGTGIGGGDV